MIKNDKDIIDRSALGFVNEVRDHFMFIEIQWGFKCIHQEDTLVRYTTGDINVNVYHGRTSFEIGVEIGNESSGRSFSLEALVALFDKDLSRKYWAAGGRTTDAIRKLLKIAAEGLNQYGADALSGDQTVFDRLEQLAVRRIDEMVLDSKAYQVRPIAEAAFKRGNYKEAVSLYSSIEKSLSSIEKKKLEIAKNKAAAS